MDGAAGQGMLGGKGAWPLDISELRELIPSGKTLLVRDGELVISQGEPATGIYFMLKGRMVVFNSIEWNEDNVIDHVDPPCVLGLDELMNQIDEYTSYVVALEDSLLFHVEAATFLGGLRANGRLCYKTLEIAACMLHKSMSSAETHKIFHQRDILGYYLFTSARGKAPLRLEKTRQSMVEELHIPLRTLNRYIGEFKERGLLELDRGKILVTPDAFHRLAQRYAKITL